MLFRRLKYIIAGRTLNTLGSIVRIIIVCVLVILCMSGLFSQRKVFSSAVSFIKNTGYECALKVKDVLNGDSNSVEVTDEGVYFKGHAQGNKMDLGETKIDPSTKEDNFVDDIINGSDSDETSEPEDSSDSENSEE